MGFDRLGLVEDGLCADIEAANGAGVDVVFFEEGRDDCGACDVSDRKERELAEIFAYQ